MDHINALEKFGLEKREATIYIKLIELGSSTANDISKHTKILRQTVYEVLERLLDKGLISYTIKSGVRYFESASPHRLNDMLLEKQQLILPIIPQLESLHKIALLKPKIEVYEGIDGLKSIYTDITKSSPKILLEYGNSAIFIEVMKLYFIDNYIKRRIENRIHVKIITEPGKNTRKLYSGDKKLLRETKYLTEMRTVKTATYIYNNKIALLSFEKNPVGVIIENESFANTQKIIFEMMWKKAIM